MSESSKSAFPQSAEWPDYLDALTAATNHHTLVFENEHVRVLDTCVKAGDQTPIHTHRWPAVFHLMSWSNFVRYDAQGTLMVDSRNVPELQKPPKYMRSHPLPPHYLVNVGETDLLLTNYEIKD